MTSTQKKKRSETDRKSNSNSNNSNQSPQSIEKREGGREGGRRESYDGAAISMPPKAERAAKATQGMCGREKKR